jgi:phage baseplate assembly protein W
MPNLPLEQIACPAFPIARGPRGFFKLARGAEVIEQSILDIIATRPGQRVRRPEYGCLIHTLVWEPADDITLSLAKRHIQDALERWEPRIAVLAIDAAFDFDSDADNPRLVGQVRWQMRSVAGGGPFSTSFQQSVRR